MIDGTDTLFYDGACGLCHRSVSFILNRGERGLGIRFAPLYGETFRRRIPEHDREHLPDSLVILTPAGDLLSRSRAVLHIFNRLGGGWCLLGWMGRILPRAFADAIYDLIARLRHRFFKKPEDVCPIMSSEQRQRFDP